MKKHRKNGAQLKVSFILIMILCFIVPFFVHISSVAVGRELKQKSFNDYIIFTKKKNKGRKESLWSFTQKTFLFALYFFMCSFILLHFRSLWIKIILILCKIVSWKYDEQLLSWRCSKIFNKFIFRDFYLQYIFESSFVAFVLL